MTPFAEAALGSPSSARPRADRAAGPGWSPRSVGVVAAGSLGIAAVAAELGGTDEGLSLCTVRHLTGGYCPGCGASRAARHLLHGEAAAAWRDHPWVVLAAVQLLVLGSMLAVALSRGHRPTLRTSWVTVFAAVNTVALVVIWAIRLGAGAIPSPF